MFVAACIIRLNDISQQHPLLLHRYENEFIWPDKDNIIYLTAGQSIRLVCSGENNGMALFNNVSEVEISCIANETFTAVLDNLENVFGSMTCNKIPKSILISTEKSCGNDFTELEIGFNTSFGVVPLITTCFDKIKKDSLYSKYRLSHALKFPQKKINRPKFISGIYYQDLDKKLDDIYKSQFNWFNDMLGTSEYIDKNIDNDYTLSKGHLTTFSHFCYYAQKIATMYYVNVAPQWKIFNGGNWRILEENIAKFAHNLSADLIVYTGIYGNAQLNSSTNHLINLHMYKSNNSIPVLTVPEVFWKVVYEPRLKLAIVFVGHNNPYETDIYSKRLCTNICDRIGWLQWNAENIPHGYSYCCDYYDFKNIVNYLPELLVYGILT